MKIYKDINIIQDDKIIIELQYTDKKNLKKNMLYYNYYIKKIKSRDNNE